MRRPHGSGSISEVTAGRWVARITLRGGKKKMRRRGSEAEALAALDEMFRQYSDELGYFATWPRAYMFGKGPQPRRKGISLKTRFLVFERDGFRCTYCGATAADARLVVDHVLSVMDGGDDDLGNLTTACLPCNAGKGSRSIPVTRPDRPSALPCSGPGVVLTEHVALS